MESLFYHFNLITYVTQIILNIKFWLSCVMKNIICAVEIKIWNYRSGGIA